MSAAVPLQSKALSRGVVALNARRVVVLGIAFGLLLFVGAQAGREFTSLFFHKVGTSASQSTFDASKGDGGSTPRDQYQEFLQSKVGHLLFSQYYSDNCRVMLFDNRTGSMVEAGEVVCGNGWVQQSPNVDQQRVRQLLQSFRR